MKQINVHRFTNTRTSKYLENISNENKTIKASTMRLNSTGIMRQITKLTGTRHTINKREESKKKAPHVSSERRMKWAFIFSSYLFSLMLFWCERKMHTTNMYSPNKMLVACTVLTVAKQCWMWKRSTNSFLRNVMIKQHRPSNPNSFTKRKYTHRLCPFQCIVIFHSRSWRVLMVIFFSHYELHIFRCWIEILNNSCWRNVRIQPEK